jgi:GT2 family glycosyltransferase
MDSNHHEQGASGAADTVTRVVIAVPFYRNEHLVAPLVGSLVACAAEIRAIGADVVFYNDSPGYGALQSALVASLSTAQEVFPCRLVCNPENLGFVRTMNRAVDEAVSRRADLLLLNSDTRVEPGALTEMVRVLRLDHMIGFVNPRSNNATIATLPVAAPAADPALAIAAYRSLAARLPDVSYVPTAVGFCLLISWRILAEFGGFDPIYGKGYNEENDLVMRAGRCGFRAVLANHAFVWHVGEESFSVAESAREVLEPRNRAILDSRYPEYNACTLAHYHTPETLAERLLAALLPDAQGKIDVAFDFSSFRAAHNGTFVAGRQLLQAAPRVWGEGFRLHVLCSQDVYDFHDYTALGVARAEPHGGRIFAAVFRIGQPYDWNAIERLMLSAPALGVYMLDTISIDCPQLASPLLYNMWQFTLDHIDVLAAQSSQTASQFAARFTIPSDTALVVSLHSLDLKDYVLPADLAAAAVARNPVQRILVLGNQFHHKFVSQTANALAEAFPDRDVVALGQAVASGVRDSTAPPPLLKLPNLSGIKVGELSDREIGTQYAACDVVVFPSHAEGFGFPLLNALAARRPVMLRRLPVFEEIWRGLGETPNIRFYETTADLVRQLRDVPAWLDWTPPPGNGGERSAYEIRAALDSAMQHASYRRIVRRVRAVQLAASVGGTRDMPAAHDRPALAARLAVERAEIVLRRVLSIRSAYILVRLFYRVARRTRHLVFAAWHSE